MKKYIQNLFMPFAILAMLTVGAFTINASEKTDKVETVMESEAENPYSGDIYIRTPNPSGPGFIFTKVGEIQEGDCGLDELTERCTMIVEGQNHELWAEVGPNNYVPLYKLED